MSDTIPGSALFTEGGNMDPSTFPPTWKGLPDASEASQHLQGLALHEVLLSMSACCQAWVTVQICSALPNCSLWMGLVDAVDCC